MKPLINIKNAISSNFSDDSPVLLFPVRIETKFKKSTLAEEGIALPGNYSINQRMSNAWDAIEIAQLKVDEMYLQPAAYIENPGLVDQALGTLLDTASAAMRNVNRPVVAEYNKLQSDFRKLASRVDQFRGLLKEEENEFIDKVRKNQGSLEKCEQQLDRVLIMGSEIVNTEDRREQTDPRLLGYYDILLSDLNREFDKLNGGQGRGSQRAQTPVSFMAIEEAYDKAVASLQTVSGLNSQDTDNLRQKENRIVQAALEFSNNLRSEQTTMESAKEAFAGANHTLEMKTSKVESEMINLENDIRPATGTKLPDDIRPAFIVKHEQGNWVVSLAPVDELLVRVYPDLAAIRTQEQKLTTDEIALAQSYWKHCWEYDGVEEVRKGYWRGLVNAFGSNRSAWIVKETTPTSMSTRPSQFSIPAAELTLIQSLDFTAVPQTDHIAEAKAYWDEIWTANGSNADEGSAWAALSTIPTMVGADSVGNHLKYALINACKPLNWEYFNGTDFDAGNPPMYPSDQEVADTIMALTTSSMLITEYYSPNFPTVATKPLSWSHASITDVMPDNFVFNLFNDDGTVDKFVGNDLDPVIITGLDPDFDDTNPSFLRDAGTGKLTVSDDIKWMTDFNEAVSKGLGIRIQLSSEQAVKGVEKLIVLGAKTSKNDQESKALIEQLFEDHHYSEDGFELFPQGAPTNNTEDKDSGYSTKDLGADESFTVEQQEPLFTTESDDIDKKDGQWFAEALGLDPSVMHHVKNSDGEDIISAMHMNQALFQGTLGLFMQVLLKEIFFHASKDTSDINALREFFVKYISARGFIPSVRIGNQPYGVLATTSYATWDSNTTGEVSDHVAYYTKRFDTIWKQIVNDDKVAYVDKVTGTEELAQENFLKVLGLNPASVAYYVRYGLSSGPAAKMPMMLQEVTSIFDYWAGLQNLMENVDSVLDRSKSLIFKTVFNGGTSSGFGNEATNLLHPREATQTPGGGVVDTNPLSRNRGIKAYSDTDSRNFIEMLLDTTPENYLQRLRAQLYDDVPNENNRPNSLLYLFLWHGLSMQYFDSSMDVLDRIKNVQVDIEEIIPLSSGAATQFENPTASPYAIIRLTAPINKRVLEHGAIIEVSGMSTSNLNGTYPIIGSDELTSAQVMLAPDCILVGNNLTVAPPPVPAPISGGYVQRRFQFRTTGRGTLYPRIGLVVRKQNGFLGHTDLTNYVGGAITGGQVIGPWKYMLAGETGYSDFAGEISTAQYLVDHLDTTVYTEESKFLKEVIRALEFLKDKSTDQLEMCFAEHIDLLSYRLDAWRQGVANQRLRDLRTANPSAGTYIGAYGWVENLRPKTRTLVPSSEIPEGYGTSDKLTLDEANKGFVHAPSIPHANTAAILRSAYFADADQANPDEMSVNLSSKRVRRALWYMEGVRNGQLLAALLGYQLERYLHDENIEANQYITELRAAFPLVSNATDNTGGDSVEAVEARNVVNGAAIVKAVTEDGNSYPFGIGLPTTGAVATAIKAGIDQILDDMDAISDLGLAEGVFHIGQGNYERGKAVLDAVSTGGRPPEFDVVKTPRTGYTLTNKVGILFDETASPGTTSRSITDPYLNKWLGDHLGAMSDIRCKVHYTDTSEVANVGEVNADQLGLEPIDLVYILRDTPRNDGSDLAVLIKKYAIQNFASIQADSIVLEFEEVDAGWAIEVKTFMEVSLLAQRLEQMMGASRAIFDDDFIPPSVGSSSLNNPRGLDIADYILRCRIALGIDAGGALTGGLAQAAFNISDIPTNTGAYPDDSTKITGYTNALQTCFEYGIVGAIAPVLTGVDADDVVTLQNKAEGILGAVSNKVIEATNLLAFDATLAINKQYELVLQAFQTLYGKSFKPAPRFAFSDAAQMTAAAAPSRSEAMMSWITAEQDYDSTEYAISVEDWLFGMSKVREKIQREESIRTILDNFDVEIQYTPLQFPVETTVGSPEYWLATEYPNTYSVDKDTSCLALQIHTATSNYSGLHVGLVFDEWNEIIPVKEETTGVAFHYDQPNAKAPNALLLAVPPKQSGNWTFENLLDTVTETFESMKKRAVEPDHLEETPLAHLLPAAMSFVSNDPRRLNMDPGANIDKLFPGTNIPYIETSNVSGGNDSKASTTVGDLLDYEYKFNNEDPGSIGAIAFPSSTSS